MSFKFNLFPYNGVVELLLASGADVNAVDRWGKTPLHVALQEKQYDTTTVLTAAGGRIIIGDEAGSFTHPTPLGPPFNSSSVSKAPLTTNGG